MLSVVNRNGRSVRTLDAAEIGGDVGGLRAAGRDRRGTHARCGHRAQGPAAELLVSLRLPGRDRTGPILIPVLEQHIRRSPHHPDHADACPFEMGDVGHTACARRLREPEAGDVFRLVGPIRSGAGRAALANNGRRYTERPMAFPWAMACGCRRCCTPTPGSSTCCSAASGRGSAGPG